VFKKNSKQFIFEENISSDEENENKEKKINDEKNDLIMENQKKLETIENAIFDDYIPQRQRNNTTLKGFMNNRILNKPVVKSIYKEDDSELVSSYSPRKQEKLNNEINIQEGDNYVKNEETKIKESIDKDKSDINLKIKEDNQIEKVKNLPSIWKVLFTRMNL